MKNTFEKQNKKASLLLVKITSHKHNSSITLQD